MTREGVEVDVQVEQIYRHVRHRLGPVDADHDLLPVGHLDQLPDWV